MFTLQQSQLLVHEILVPISPFPLFCLRKTARTTPSTHHPTTQRGTGRLAANGVQRLRPF